MSGSRASKIVKLGYALAIVLWLLSLLLPAAEVNGSTRIAGYRALVLGIDAMGAGIPGWLANPVSLLALIAGLSDRRRTAVAFGAVACALGLSSFLAPDMARADGLPITDVTFRLGFFVWLAAFSLIFATSCVALLDIRAADKRRDR